jgi:intraflagellar transport protein 80
MDID